MLGKRQILCAPVFLVALCAGSVVQTVTPAFAAGSPATGTTNRTQAPPQARSAAPGPRNIAPTETNRAAAPAARSVAPATAGRSAPAARAPQAPRAVAAPHTLPAVRASVVHTVQPAIVPTNIEHGIAMHYYPGLFDTVARNRGMVLRTDVDGYASRQSCSELGRVVKARIYDPYWGTWGPWKRYEIIDCSNRRDVGYHRQIGLILEVDYHSAATSHFVYRGWSQVQVQR